MDLIPQPGQVVSAAANLLRLTTRSAADSRPMPREMVTEGIGHEVHHYVPMDGVAGVAAAGDPVLLVPSLAAPALCYDLRRGCSLVEHLVGTGRPTYLVEYDPVALREQSTDLAPCVDEVLPSALRAVSAHATRTQSRTKTSDRPVHLVGWSLGGVMALLTAAAHRDLPLASVTVLAAPVDLAAVPLVAPLRPLAELPSSLASAARVLEMVGPARPLVDWARELAAYQRLVDRPVAAATHLDDRDYLAQLEAVERFQRGMSAYRGRTYGQLYHRFLPGNALASGSLPVGGRTVSLAKVTAPVLAISGTTDGIAPTAATHPLEFLLTGATEVRFEVVSGGHLGQLTGRGARTGTWPVLDEWLAGKDHARPTRSAKPSTKRTTKASPKTAPKSSPKPAR